MTDRSLVDTFLRNREERAFRALYRRHTPVLYGLALRLLGGDHRDAEDAVQETWSRAVGRLSTFRWEAALSTWLSAILIRHCRERWRHAGVTCESIDVTPDHAQEDTALMALADRIDLTRAVAALPDGYRFVLVLHDIEGYTHEEIAALIGIEIGTSKSQLSRARRSVRARLSGTASHTRGEPHEARP